MNYRSPVRLVSYAGESPNPFSLQAIGRARKKLLAEITLSEEDIVIDGIAYGRNDIVTLLDAEASERDWPAHCYIYTYPALLRLLEQNVFDSDEFRQDALVAPAPGQAGFISNYFASSFNEVTRILLRERDFKELSRLLHYKTLIAPEDNHVAYQRIRVYLDDLIYTVRNMGWEKFSLDTSVLNFLFEPGFASFLNSLPALFNGTRDTLVFQVILLVERFQKKATWRSLHTICKALQGIECSPNVAAEVSKFERVMRKNSGWLSQMRGPGRIIWVIVWAAFIAVRIMSGNSDNSSDRYRFINDALSQINVKPVPLEMNRSSENEAAFKDFLIDISGNKWAGADKLVNNGEAPFSGISTRPMNVGSGSLTISNTTTKDAVLLYFPYGARFIDTTDKINAVFIKQGNSAVINFEPGFSRINFLYGNGWIKLATPLRFSMSADSAGKQQRTVKEFFRNSPKRQYYLTRNLFISSYELKESADSSLRRDQIYRPAYDGSGSARITASRAELKLVEKGGRVEVQGSGDYYIYSQMIKQ